MLTVYMASLFAPHTHAMSETIKAFAHPRVQKGETAHGFNVTLAPLTVEATLTPTTKNSLFGTARLTAEQITQLTGQCHVDFAHIDKITATAGFTNVSETVGTTLKLGQEQNGTLAPFSTIDRQMHLRDNQLTATHFMLRPASGNGEFTSTGFAGSVTPAFGQDQQERFDTTSNALARSVRWRDTAIGDHKVLAQTCTKIGDGPTARYLVPHAGTGTQCAAAKLWTTNGTKSDFCGGAYTDKNRSTAVDMNGRDCTVVTAAHMDTVLTTLGSKLNATSPLKNGLTVSFETMGHFDGKKEYEALTSAGFLPQASITLNFERESTASVMDTTTAADMSASAVHSLEDAHMWIGEGAPAAATMSATAITAADMASRVLQMTLKGETTAAVVAAPFETPTVMLGLADGAMNIDAAE